MEVTARLVPVSEPTHVAESRRWAAELTAALEFDEVAAGRVAIAVTEAASNLLKHAGGGDLFLGLTGAGHTLGVQLVAMDRGRGISSVEASLRDGYSTAGTAGTGLGAIRRSATTFDVHTSTQGTVLAATFFPSAPPPAAIGAVCVPIQGERRNGDGWAAWTAGELTSIFLVDGLGHGADAARAADAAVEVFRRHAERSAEEVITNVHERLGSTRGAAVALAELDRRTSSLRYCGLGNISAAILSPGGETAQRLVSLSGIAGHVMRRLQQFVYPWPKGSTLVMHSDGIGTHWSLDKYPGLAGRRPDVVAGVIYRDFKRGRDDATVVVTASGEAA